MGKLVLTRRVDQAIVIRTRYGKIKILVVGIDGSRVRLGIDAPASVLIYREELETRVPPDQ